jgi:putative transposase
MMQRKRHTEEQVIAILKEHEAGMILKEHEAGMKTADLCRKYGISEASFYNWKSQVRRAELRLKKLDEIRPLLSISLEDWRPSI